MSSGELIEQGRQVSDSESFTRQLMELDVGGMQRQGLNNFDGTPDERLRLILLATGGGAKQGADLVDEVFNVKYWFAHKVVREDRRSGEIQEFVRTVLINPELQAISFSSQGVFDVVRNIVAFQGRKVFDPALCVRIVKKKTLGGFTMLSLEPIMPAPKKAQEAAKK